MFSNRIQNGQTETIVAMMVKSRSPLSGLTDVLLTIRRTSDDYFYDFDDNTFKNAGWVEKEYTMGEVGTSGQYEYDFNTTGFSDDTYICTMTCATSNDSTPQIGELIVGGYIDYIDYPISSVLSRLEELVIAEETTAAAGSTTTEIRTGLTEADGFYNNMQVVVINADGVVSRNVDDFTQTDGILEVLELPFTPSVGDKVIILARTGSVPLDTAAIAAAVNVLLSAIHGAGSWTTFGDARFLPGDC